MDFAKTDHSNRSAAQLSSPIAEAIGLRRAARISVTLAIFRKITHLQTRLRLYKLFFV
ncbi:MAG: hypothetical protein MRY21_05270 [Simkaniaceae bacterium]|nr:hypothetical protein [Simkaniaceae bacterium]